VLKIKAMNYAKNLITAVRDSDKWPSFERPSFLDELDEIATEALSKK